MAIVKKGSRIIIIDDIKYRWTIRKKPTYNQAAFGSHMTTAVEIDGFIGSVLLITFSRGRCDNWLGKPGLSIKPNDIECAIKLALKKGWKPKEQGDAFQLNFSGL
mgnify:CR=1 FL=1|tara:strand:- start:506 stop:820 length:315 start_codon:yes stop_codon:yes gene_type:complete